MRQSRNGENSAVVSEIEQNARKLASFMYDIWDDTRDGADYPQLRNRSGMSELICAPAFKYAVDKGWFVQGPGHDQDQKWHLNFSGSSGSSSPTESPCSARRRIGTDQAGDGGSGRGDESQG